MSLKKSALGNHNGEQPINPEIDAKLNQYIKDHQKLYEHYKTMPHELLVRKQMLASMNRADYKAGKDQEVVDLVNANPELKARVEARVLKEKPERRERAFINAARDEMLAFGKRLLTQGQAPAVTGIKP